MNTSIESFEHLVHTRQHEAAIQALFGLLYSMDNCSGSMDAITCIVPVAPSAMPREVQLCDRIAAATSRLFLDEDFTLSPQGFLQLMCVQRWLSLIYGCTAQRHADHVIRTLCGVSQTAPEFVIPPHKLAKCLFLMTTESELPLDLDQLWNQSQTLAAALYFGWLSTTIMASNAAHQKREALLAWWPMRIHEAMEFANWPLPILHQVYMLCSYGTLDTRHAIKKPLNTLIRQFLYSRGLGDLNVLLPPVKLAQPPVKRTGTKAKSAKSAKPTDGVATSKPVMLVVTEWFSPGFAVYRTHSMTLRAARDQFHLVGVGSLTGVNHEGQAVFHEFHEMPTGDPLDAVAFVRNLADDIKPQIVYYLGVGMFAHTVYLSNLRLAPIQVVSNGHGASTHSMHMDYFMTDEGYISGQAAFSEAILPLPANVMQMIPNVDTPQALLEQVQRVPREHPAIVRVAVAAALLKINPVFLGVLRTIAQRSEAMGLPLEFHFPMAQAVGPLYYRIRTEIEAQVNDDLAPRRAFVYPHQDYEGYMKVIAQCDFFVNPFPYGNTNGIADMALLGMPGICKAGPELAEHIDAGMLKHLGLPDWCVAWTLDDYVTAALRMAHQHEERFALSQQLIKARVYCRLSENQKPKVMGEILLKKCA